jgi:hypothetical protein
MMKLFITALGTALAIAAPVGPVSFIFLRNILGAEAKRVPLMSFWIAAVSIMVFAALQLKPIAEFLVTYKHILYGIGGVAFIHSAYSLAGAPAFDQKKAFTKTSTALMQDLSYIVLFTVTSPAAIALLVHLKNPTGSLADLIVQGLGLFTGEFLWWIGLGWTFLSVQKKISPGWLSRIQKISALFLLVMGLYFLYLAIMGTAHGL